MKSYRKFTPITINLTPREAIIMTKMLAHEDEIIKIVEECPSKFMTLIRGIVDKQIREGLDVSIELKSDSDLSAMWDLSYNYEVIGELLGDRFKAMLIDLNNELSSDCVVEEDELDEDASEKEQFTLTDKQNEEMSEYVENKQLSDNSKELKSKIRQALLKIETDTYNTIRQLRESVDVDATQLETLDQSLAKSSSYERVSSACESLDYYRYSEEQEQELRRRVAELEKGETKTFSMEEAIDSIKARQQAVENVHITPEDIMTYKSLAEANRNTLTTDEPITK